MCEVREREAGGDLRGGSREWIGRLVATVWPEVERSCGEEQERGGVGSRNWWDLPFVLKVIRTGRVAPRTGRVD